MSFDYKFMVKIMWRSTLVPLLFILSTSSLRADELNDFCTRRAIDAVAEVRQEHYPQISEREIGIARKTAIIACISSRSTKLPIANNESVAISDDKDDSDEKSNSWIERLLDNEEKEDVSPMMKNHRTGGK